MSNLLPESQCQGGRQISILGAFRQLQQSRGQGQGLSGGETRHNQPACEGPSGQTMAPAGGQPAVDRQEMSPASAGFVPSCSAIMTDNENQRFSSDVDHSVRDDKTDREFMLAGNKEHIESNQKNGDNETNFGLSTTVKCDQIEHKFEISCLVQEESSENESHILEAISGVIHNDLNEFYLENKSVAQHEKHCPLTSNVSDTLNENHAKSTRKFDEIIDIDDKCGDEKKDICVKTNGLTNDSCSTTNSGESLTSVIMYETRRTRQGLVRTPQSTRNHRSRHRNSGVQESLVCPVCGRQVVCAGLGQFNEHVDECLHQQNNVLVTAGETGDAVHRVAGAHNVESQDAVHRVAGAHNVESQDAVHCVAGAHNVESQDAVHRVAGAHNVESQDAAGQQPAHCGHTNVDQADTNKCAGRSVFEDGTIHVSYSKSKVYNDNKNTGNYILTVDNNGGHDVESSGGLMEKYVNDDANSFSEKEGVSSIDACNGKEIYEPLELCKLNVCNYPPSANINRNTGEFLVKAKHTSDFPSSFLEERDNSLRGKTGTAPVASAHEGIQCEQNETNNFKVISGHYDIKTITGIEMSSCSTSNENKNSENVNICLQLGKKTDTEAEPLPSTSKMTDFEVQTLVQNNKTENVDLCSMSDKDSTLKVLSPESQSCFLNLSQQSLQAVDRNICIIEEKFSPDGNPAPSMAAPYSPTRPLEAPVSPVGHIEAPVSPVGYIEVPLNPREAQGNLASALQVPVRPPGSLLVCPVCNMEQRLTSLTAFNGHVDQCLSRGAISEILQQQRDQEKNGGKR